MYKMSSSYVAFIGSIYIEAFTIYIGSIEWNYKLIYFCGIWKFCFKNSPIKRFAVNPRSDSYLFGGVFVTSIIWFKGFDAIKNRRIHRARC